MFLSCKDGMSYIAAVQSFFPVINVDGSTQKEKWYIKHELFDGHGLHKGQRGGGDHMIVSDCEDDLQKVL